ncbi:MAG: hypothetical protein EXR69_04845 [Myxococcales bacterium]|nr:hypothetical protein [Myxococcales bacterium]
MICRSSLPRRPLVLAPVPVLVPALLLGLTALGACSIDNGLSGLKDNPGADNADSGFSPDTGGGNTDVCGPLNLDCADAGVDETCEAEAHAGSFTPIVKWMNESVGDAYATPVVARLTDTDGDGRLTAADMPTVVVANAVGELVAMRGDDGTVLWRAGSFGAEPMTPAIGDLDGDGWPEVVGAGTSGTSALRGTDGSVYWRSPAYVGGKAPNCGAVGIYDLDADGLPEVIIGGEIKEGTTGVKLAQGRGDGSGNYGFSPFGVAADINQDGQLEVIVGNAVYDKSGRSLWNNGQSDGFVAVANFDADPYGEIVVSNVGTVRLQDDDGTVLWSKPGTMGSTSGSPTVADFDGDGNADIGVAGNNVYKVFDRAGNEKWRVRVQDSSSGFTGSSVFDFEGDGKAEVVYADENDLYVFDGATGAVKLKQPEHSSATCSEYPAVADVDNDGHAEIIYTSSAYSGSEIGVRVVGDADNSWMPSRAVWNQHAYNITNISDDGSVPALPLTNWLTYNNFRSGDLAAATGGALSDAIPVQGDACLKECASGRLSLVVAIGNQGTSELPAGVALSAYAVTDGPAVFLQTQTVPDAVPSGTTSVGLQFDFDTADLPFGPIQFIADDANGVGVVTECNEDNNTLVISEELCP